MDFLLLLFFLRWWHSFIGNCGCISVMNFHLFEFEIQTYFPKNIAHLEPVI